MLESRSGDREIEPSVADARSKPAPAPRNWNIEGQNALAIGTESRFEPGGELACKLRVNRALSLDPEFYLSDGDAAEKKVGRICAADPCDL